ncbi:MAG: hypothetical protein JWL79_3725 [Frankiales bacterium]|nr:hypothetical protein [Frankiales bacterium]
MRVGVYVDGFNLYYGARAICGRSTPGWRWLDLRGLAHSMIASHAGWAPVTDLRVVYCTARISGASNPGGQRDQDVYLRALQAHGSADVIEMGQYVSRVATAPLASPDRKGRPVLTTSSWPVMVQDSTGQAMPDARFMVSVARREEKGSDVNVATHLLLDVLESSIDGAVVISNDSDLRLPVEEARKRVSVGLVNPTKNFPAGAMNASASVGVGGHWWYQLQAADLMAAQMPSPLGRLTKPGGW